MPMEKPFSQACENNKGPILEVLKKHFRPCSHILEIGSGTGQHGVHFAPALPHLIWQCSDMPGNHAGINAWIDEAPAHNLKRPVAFTIGQHPWPKGDFDGVFSANTAHIMQPQEARLMMELVAHNLPKGGIFCQYGPFNIDGRYTSDSNRSFDESLRNQGYGGIRDIGELQDWAVSKLQLVERLAMPANNFTLVWRKV
ncbi:DUF938 domain-containing protein [Aliiglaciecola sp. CAU 1673]|uniref:DUF938 domain-containing protein n=1 Tax=Aliiglaciecola sp. CAU 1673 TaxID=3032595 RepID=UPI0023DA5982|nr:DUF938 domain-containing protein [Aliiglaciecola sp. CAU 1673]MDF2178258.1 DUF938 domain-containing protein [Aliiglaciecola sp. CAU 1673]